MPRRDSERILEMDVAMEKALQAAKKLEGVRGVSAGKWIRIPHSRLDSGTIVPIGPEGQTFKAKLYKGRPDPGYIPLTIYLTSLCTPHQIEQSLEARNRMMAEERKERVLEGLEIPTPTNRFANNIKITPPQEPKAEPQEQIAQPPLREKAVKAAPAEELVDTSAAAKILGITSKAGVAYYVKTKRLKVIVKKGPFGPLNYFKKVDVEGLRANKNRVGAPAGGHQVKAVLTVEQKFDRMIELLSTLTQQNAKLLEVWQ
jgi:hypothetical protein